MSTHTTSPMFRALAAAVRANVPTLIWGEPGVGKTAKIEAQGAAWGREVRTIAASSREAVDFMGLPMEKDGRVIYSPLSWALELNQAKRGLLVVDEITTAASTFKAFLRIVQERYVGELKLDDTVSIVALANPPEIAVEGVDLPAPVANRFMHLDWVFDRDEWFANVGSNFEHVQTATPDSYLTRGTNADRARAAAQVTGFLKANPRMLNQVPTSITDQGKAWPSARTWTNVIDTLTYLPESDDDARDLVVKGLVGEGALIEFRTWVRRADLPNPQSVLDNPTSQDWRGLAPDVAFAILQGARDLVKMDDTAEQWNKGCDLAAAVAREGRPDIALPLATALTTSRHVREGFSTAFKEAFTDLCVRTGRVRV